MLSVAKARSTALSLPEVEERLSHGIPTFRVGGKIFAILREEWKSFVFKLDPDACEALIAARPEIFYIADHYKNYPMVLAHLDKIPVKLFRELLNDAWMS